MEGLHTSRARPSPANSTESWTVLQRLLDNYEEGNTGWRAAKPLAEAFSEALLGHQRRGSPEQLRSAPPPLHLTGGMSYAGRWRASNKKHPVFSMSRAGRGNGRGPYVQCTPFPRAPRAGKSEGYPSVPCHPFRGPLCSTCQMPLFAKFYIITPPASVTILTKFLFPSLLHHHTCSFPVPVPRATFNHPQCIQSHKTEPYQQRSSVLGPLSLKKKEHLSYLGSKTSKSVEKKQRRFPIWQSSRTVAKKTKKKPQFSKVSKVRKLLSLVFLGNCLIKITIAGRWIFRLQTSFHRPARVIWASIVSFKSIKKAVFLF